MYLIFIKTLLKLFYLDLLKSVIYMLNCVNSILISIKYYSLSLKKGCFIK